MATIAEALAQAVQRHHLGDVQQAEQIYRQVVATDPGNADAWCYLGVACLSTGRVREAVDHYQRAIRLRPDHAPAHGDLGIVLAQLDRRDEAVACMKEALRLQPDSAEILSNLGVVLGQQGRFEEAESCFRQALRLKPNHVWAYTNFSLVLKDLGKLEEAVECLREAVRLQPDNADAHYGLGNMLMHQEKLTDALPHFRQALQCNPYHAHACHALGAALLKLGRPDEALPHLRLAVQLCPGASETQHHLGNALLDLGLLDEAVPHLQQAVQLKPQDPHARKDLGRAMVQWWQRVVEQRPTDADACNELGSALKGQGRLEEAVESYRRALELKPGSVETLNNLAAAYADMGKPEEAEKIYREVVQLRPNFVEALSNLGTVLKSQGKLEEALACYDRALQLRPDASETHKARAMTWIQQGKYLEGWKEYEWRWQCHDFHPRKCRQPQWDGSPLAGRTILLHAEQGLGDILQFIRYAPMVKARGGTVLFESPRQLVRLLQRCRGIDRVVPLGCFLPDFDVHVPLLSLPYLFGTTLGTVPQDIPYLFPASELLEKWRQELTANQEQSAQNRAGKSGSAFSPFGPQFKVGIAWRGGPSHTQDRHRSVPLAHFAPLARVEGVQLFSLQKGNGSEELARADFPITDLGSKLADFMDTAAVLKHLDLVVTVDTAVAHCAGGLGVPVWVALPFSPDFRWMLEREDSPWYPSMRLFRPRRWGHWTEVFERIAQELKYMTNHARERVGNK